MIKIDTRSIKSDKIEDVYKKYVLQKLKDNIENELKKENNPALTDAHKIAITFLKRHFHDDHGILSDVKISTYLFEKNQENPKEYLESIIISYWDSLVEVWSKQTGNPKPADSFIVALSKWELIKKQALSEPNEQQRIALVMSIIQNDTCALFSNVSKTDLFNWSIRGKLSDTKLKSIGINYHENTLKILGSIFNYSEILNDSSIVPTPRHQILSAMRVSVCPYCNRQYITIYTDADTNTEKTTADLDHYYIKSDYPYLALSFYNFIPSCQICNSRFKQSKDFYLYPHIYPYTQEFGDSTRFSINLSPDLMKLRDSWEDPKILSIDSSSEPNERKCAIANAIDTFHLNEVYRSHLDYAQEIYVKSQEYNKTSIELLQPLLSQFDSNRRVADIFFGQYLQEDMLHKRPLSKLARDILTEYCGDLIDQ